MFFDCSLNPGSPSFKLCVYVKEGTLQGNEDEVSAAVSDVVHAAEGQRLDKGVQGKQNMEKQDQQNQNNCEDTQWEYNRTIDGIPPDSVYFPCPVCGASHVTRLKDDVLSKTLRLGPPDEKGRRAVDMMIVQDGAVNYNSQFQHQRREVVKCVMKRLQLQDKKELSWNDLPPLYRDKRYGLEVERDDKWSQLSKTEKRKIKDQIERDRVKELERQLKAVYQNPGVLQTLGWCSEDYPHKQVGKTNSSNM